MCGKRGPLSMGFSNQYIPIVTDYSELTYEMLLEME
jgi:hypothetical protein